MEFKFSVNDLFKHTITKVPDTLLPTGFVAQDRRTLVECQAKVAEVLNCMGQASAVAQGLSKPITSAERLRTSDHTVYVLVDPEDGRHGSVTGLLKVGRKRLYVFDPSGRHHQLRPLCVLDFYVHESRQRSGLGRRLFDYMLQDEDVEPVRLAIDRPSDKFLGFLSKHYNLRHVLPQMNNFVVFEGFFVPSDEIDPGRVSPSNFVNKMSPNNKSYLTHEDDSGVKKPPYNGLQLTPTYGRYGAPRPNCTMGQIIHNNPTPGPQQPTGC